MKRTEYSFGKIDFNGSRAVIPTSKQEANTASCFFIKTHRSHVFMAVADKKNIACPAILKHTRVLRFLQNPSLSPCPGEDKGI